MLTSNIQKKFKKLNIHSTFRKNFRTVIYPGDCLNLLKQIPDESIQLIVVFNTFLFMRQASSTISNNIY